MPEIPVDRAALANRVPDGGDDVARAAGQLGLTPLEAYRALLADGVAREEVG